MSRRLLTVVLVLPTLATAAVQSPTMAAERPPTCHGERATIVGTRGSDLLTGTPGRDVILARAGDDLVRGRGGDDLVCGGRGSDVLVGGAGDDRLYGQRGSHRKHGKHVVVEGDRLAGGPGDDLLSVGVEYGRHVRVGRPDEITYRSSGHAVHVDLRARTSFGEGHDTIARAARLSVIGSSYDDVLAGSGRDEALDGRGGDDVLLGRSGRDLLQDGGGDDEMRGGPGQDATVSLRGEDTLYGGRGFDWMIAASSKPAVVHGGRGFDYVQRQITPGETGVLDGGPGHNQLELDPLFPDDITATVDGGAGTAVVEHGGDTMTASFGGFAAFTMWGSGSWTYRGTDERDFLQVLDGSVDATTLGGDDAMIGGTEDDTLDGGDGTDSAWGGEGTNVCIDDEQGDCNGYPWPQEPSAGRSLPTQLRASVARSAVAARLDRARESAATARRFFASR